ncbi:MAG: isoprenylcysteine carboxylmethyltransferase family protein [Gammaproteobacteria bacterium]|nr:isoprenylcysteine carboxylmethyltransferase family protein [Gammaproteobacteria bacterium]
MQRALIQFGKFFFKYRDAVAPIVFLALVLATKPRLAFGSARGDLALDAFGVIAVVGAQILRATVIGYAYIIRGGKDKKVYAETLVQEGFFAHCRNPLYLGNLLGILGLLIIHNSPWAYAIGIPFSLCLYMTIIAAEEDFLARKFGAEYERYRQRVPRFIPVLAGLNTTVVKMKYNWKRLISKEYGTTFNGGTMMLLLLAWESYRNFGYARSVDRFQVLGLLFFVLALGYSTARVMKKQGMLDTA